MAPTNSARAALSKWFAGDSASAADDPYFLPNFCHARMVASVALVAQLLAFVITLITRRVFANVFVDLVMISIFVQWVALASVGVLCVSRRHLRRLPDRSALLLVYAMLLAVTLIVGEIGLWTAAAVGLIGSVRPEWYGYFHVQNFFVSAIANALVLRYFLAKHELRQRTASEARARIQALQAKVRPTFLFNTMNVIAALTRSAPQQAEAAIEDMADIVRVMLADAPNLVPVRNEIEVSKKYLSLETLRLEGRLKSEWDVGKLPRTAVMPMLSLQPLLESAIFFGIEPATIGGTIKIRLWEQDERILVQIATPLPPAGAARAHKEQNAALENFRQRLDSYYGDAAHMEVIRDNLQYRIEVDFPARGGRL